MELLFTILICLLIFAFMFAEPINKVVFPREIEVMVTEKGIKNSKGQGRYLIFAKDETNEIITLEISDSLFKMRFDSSDVYAQIQPNTKYKFSICGKRVPLFSWYPNIYKIEKIE